DEENRACYLRPPEGLVFHQLRQRDDARLIIPTFDARRERMRATIAAVMVLLAACGPRQVEVRTAPTQDAEVAIHFTNNLSKAVNVYVNTGGSDMFVRQVAGSTTEHLPVAGIQSGTVV